MEPFDLTKSLQFLGVDERTAEELKARLTGDDLMAVINALNTDDLGHGIPLANKILGKYNVTLGGSNQVDEYRNAELEALKNGDLFAVENFINEWLSPVTGAKLGEGFDYAVELSEAGRDKVLDWLDENKIEYMAQTPNVFHIRCEDRASAYRVSKALSGMMGRPVVRDSQVAEDDVVAEKNINRRIRDAKDKLANQKERNPVVQGMIGRGGGGAHKGDARKADEFSRGAKYKPRYDEDLEGADEGDLSMNEENNEERLEEGVMGFAGLNPIFRLKELAGIRSGKLPETELVEIDGEDDHIGDMAADAAMGDIDAPDAGDVELGPDLGGAADMAMDAPADDMGMDPMGADPMADPMVDPMGAPADDMGMDPMGADPMGADPMGGDLGAIDDPMGGIPGDLPPMGAEPALGVGIPMQSEAMMTIEDSLNGIQAKLPEIRLSEYKSLVLKLQDLANQVQAMGRDYLGERRLKK